MKIAVFGNKYQSAYAKDLRTFLCGLTKKGTVKLIIEKSFYDYLCGIIGEIPGSEPFEADRDFRSDLALSIGGDGTFLHTAAAVASREIPIMGINTGHLGYLSAATLASLHELTRDIVSGNYIVEDRTMLCVDSPEELPDGFRKLSALNEVVVQRPDITNMIEADVFLDGRFLASCVGDGLIIATPTGSTAYNLSAGGPILAPNAPSWVLTPVAPHSLTMRPLVVDYDTEIRVKVRSRSSRYTVSVDGHSALLPSETELVIRRAPYVTKLVRTTDHTFIDTLRNKLLWGVTPR